MQALDDPMLQQIIDRRLAGQEQVDRQPRALPAPLPGADPRGGAHARSTTAASATSRRARTSASRKRDISEPVFGHAPRRRARDGAPGQPGIRARRPASSGRRAAAAAARGRARRSDAGEGEDDFVFHLTQGRVHADLLRRPRAAAPDRARSCAETPEMEEPPRRLLSDGTPTNLHVLRSMRGALGRRIAIGADSRARAARARGRSSTSCSSAADARRGRSRKRELEAARSQQLRARLERDPVPRPDRPALPQPRARAGADQPRR